MEPGENLDELELVEEVVFKPEDCFIEFPETFKSPVPFPEAFVDILDMRPQFHDEAGADLGHLP